MEQAVVMCNEGDKRKRLVELFEVSIGCYRSQLCAAVKGLSYQMVQPVNGEAAEPNQEASLLLVYEMTLA